MIKMFLFLLLPAALNPGPAANAEKCIVTACYADIVTVERADGSLFEFYGADYHAGQLVNVVFDNAGTPAAYDDIVVNVF